MDAPYTVFNFDCPSRVDLESTGPKKLTFPVSAKLTYTFPASEGRKEMKLSWYQGPAFAASALTLAAKKPDLVAQADALMREARVDDPSWPMTWTPKPKKR